jgi:hypothetical protein
MNDTMTPVRSLDRDRHQVSVTDVRLSLADRLSVRLGVWLLLRAERRIDRERHADLNARSLAAARARAEHERAIADAWQFAQRMY